MPKFLINRWHGMHVLWGLILLLILNMILLIYQWEIGAAGLLLTGVLVYYAFIAEKAFRKDLNNYIATLSHRVKRAGYEVISGLPIGMVLYNDEKMIEWHNPYISKIKEKESIIGQQLYEMFPVLKNKKEKEETVEAVLGNRAFHISIKPDERMLFITDITDYKRLSQKYQEEKSAIGIIMLDNLEEATQGMDDQTRSILLAKVAGEITEWANKYHLYLRRFASDKFLILMNHKALISLEQSRFEILDDVRDLTMEYKLPLTLSIGIGAGAESLVELGQLAQSSLDIALGRGGDQVAVRLDQRLSFYGGRSNAVEKRTRVRARVISHALRDLIRESDKVIIVGHRMPDMDAIGAAVGILKAAQMNGREGYIVLEGVNPSIHKLMQEIRENENLSKWFITPEQALLIISQRSLVVVVDTHKASMVPEPKLLQLTQRIVVVDHHRRSEEFIGDAVLVYMEPYASSTCELVTELLQYIHERLTLDVMEATVLLAGIIVDTKSFSMRTGARTFEAASFLRRNGADTTLIQKILQEDLEEYLKKTEIIRNSKLLYNHLVIAVADKGKKYSQVLIAQVADTLLNMTNVMASFVISERNDGLIGISARSLGQINVQVIMERLNGGGHLTNAATQLECTLEEAEAKLNKVLKEIQEEEGFFE
ncbi:DHH family phosphoesterase [Ferviditalea candida]|uniref:Cyclic-di-AMP phosphodiesterase n=1 Tax=Ferviditalea candida TaxID=3108399 RepID=A0ABU5ZPN2_9BACL|nr:DHH family phosphoesterase [Paenibacillaceae bacterium T2]